MFADPQFAYTTPMTLQPTAAHRYAIYFCPEPDSPLAKAGADWLGRDIETGGERSSTLEIPGIDRLEVTHSARRYGFHATLKAPFRPAEGVTEEHLIAACEAIALDARPIEGVRMDVGRLGGFLALLLENRRTEVGDLAGTCVEALDGLRAPMTATEREKRGAAGLSQAHQDLLDRWGYPFVFDEFRFHMTLTKALPEEDLDRVEQALRGFFSASLAQPQTVGSICLCAEPAPDSAFAILRRFVLGQ